MKKQMSQNPALSKEMQSQDLEKAVDIKDMVEDMVDTEVDMEEALEALEGAKAMEDLEVEKDRVVLVADMEDMAMVKGALIKTLKKT